MDVAHPPPPPSPWANSMPRSSRACSPLLHIPAKLCPITHPNWLHCAIFKHEIEQQRDGIQLGSVTLPLLRRAATFADALHLLNLADYFDLQDSATSLATFAFHTYFRRSDLLHLIQGMHLREKLRLLPIPARIPAYASTAAQFTNSSIHNAKV